MLSKYGLMAMAFVIMGLGAYIWYLDRVIENRDTTIEVLTSKNAACNASNENLKNTIESQNKKIKVFAEHLKDKNEVLVTIETKNKILQKEVKKKIDEINQVQHSTCKDTINWMLKEAIEYHETKS